MKECESLILAVPLGLLFNLADAGEPSLDFRTRKAKRPTSLRTSDRNSLLRYMGLPLHTFGAVRPPCISLSWTSAGTDERMGGTIGRLLSTLFAVAADRQACSEIVVDWDDK